MSQVQDLDWLIEWVEGAMPKSARWSPNCSASSDEGVEVESLSGQNRDKRRLTDASLSCRPQSLRRRLDVHLVLNRERTMRSPDPAGGMGEEQEERENVRLGESRGGEAGA